jgi:hypothetical protein
VSFAGQVPAFFIPPSQRLGGPRDRHKVLVGTQVLAVLQSLALAVVT